MFSLGKKRSYYSLESKYPDVGLKKAREKVREIKKLIVFPQEAMKVSHSNYILPFTDTLIDILKYF